MVIRSIAGTGVFMPTPDLALSVRKVSREASMRIAESAFALAMTRERRRVTAVHKANVLRISDGLSLECVREVAARHPQVVYEEQLVDAMAALLVHTNRSFKPVAFVIITTFKIN